MGRSRGAVRESSRETGQWSGSSLVTRWRAAIGVGVGLALGVAGLAGCGSDEASSATSGGGSLPVATFAGRIDGGEPDATRLLAVVASGTTALAYLCDGADEVVWFAGTVDGDHLELTDRAGRPLSLDVDGNSVTGSLGDQDVDVPAVAEPAGLYVLDPASGEEVLTTYLGGWIVLPDGTQTGGVRSNSGVTNPRMDPATRTTNITDGTSNTVVSFGATAGSGGFQFQFGNSSADLGGFGQFGGSGFSQFGAQFGQFGNGASSGIQFGG